MLHHYITEHEMNRLNKTESAIVVSLACSLLPEDLHSELILDRRVSQFNSEIRNIVTKC